MALLPYLALWAVTAQTMTDDAIAERLKPAGQVCVMGEECKLWVS
jgi:hypothetical protein